MQLTTVNSLVLGASLLLAASGCNTAPAQVSSNPSSVHTSAPPPPYADALEEAFARYEGEIDAASQIVFHSQAEMDAVTATLSEARFDWALRQALASRGLSVDGLADYAMEKPEFFHAEQQRHWGRLARARARMDSFKLVPSEGSLALADDAEATPLTPAASNGDAR